MVPRHCHNTHVYEESTDPLTGITADNLKLVRSTISTASVSWVQNPVVFQQRPQHYATAASGGVHNGICQACHTETNHYTNDDSADQNHQEGSDCMVCHSHTAQFNIGPGSCNMCHEYPPPNGDHNNHIGSTHHSTGFNGTISCDTCHAGGTHVDDTVDVAPGLGYTYDQTTGHS